jgi:drug/metabolite transporter (DMT)-like permease
MPFLPTLLGLFTALCWGSADFLSRTQSGKVGYYRTTVYVHVVTTATLLLFIPVLQPKLVFDLDALAALAISGAVNFFAFLFLYRAFHRGVVSVVAPIAYTYPAVTTILAVLVLGTVLSLESALALSAIMLGVILLSTRFSELRKRAPLLGGTRLSAGVGWAIAASVSFGAIYVVVGEYTPVLGYVLPSVMLRGVGTLTGFLAAPILGEKVRPNRASLSTVVFSMGVLESLGFLSFNFGISLGGSSLPIVAAMSGMGGAVATAYALVLLRERLERNQVLGVALAFVGVFALLYFTA